jgi:hypothetical protein
VNLQQANELAQLSGTKCQVIDTSRSCRACFDIAPARRNERKDVLSVGVRNGFARGVRSLIAKRDFRAGRWRRQHSKETTCEDNFHRLFIDL